MKRIFFDTIWHFLTPENPNSEFIKFMQTKVISLSLEE